MTKKRQQTLPKKNEVIVITGPNGKQAVLRKNSSGRDYNLRKFGLTRVRFGNAKQIREDVEHFRTYGVLPLSKASEIY